MKKNLTSSAIDRQNIINNPYALEEIEKAIGIKGAIFEGILRFTKKQIAEFFEIDQRTVDNYLKRNKEELRKNGYEVLRGNRLKQFKLAIRKVVDNDTDFVTKTTALGIFDFRTFLNLGMLLKESNVAVELRQTILDIVIDTINKRSGGSTKYINQRDRDFVVTFFKNEDYRKGFTDALRDYVDMGNFKYPLYTDKIYKNIFREKADEYRKILKLSPKDDVRKSLYSEVLLLVSSFEYGFTELLKAEYCKKQRKLSAWEAEAIFQYFVTQPHWKPLVEDARSKMASRDLCFRDALHLQLEEYLSTVSREDFEKFLGSSSMNVEEQLQQFQDVFKRLKERK